MMRYILAGILALMVFAIGLMTFQWYRDQNSSVAFGAPFELVNHNGEKITDASFRGDPTAVFFGFTHCPEVCPTTLFELDGWLDQMGGDGEEIKAYFVTVDPERDTPEVMKTYLENVSNRIMGVTGDSEEVAEMLKGFHIFARKVELDDGGYTMDHSASVMLLDRKGDFFGTIAYQENSETAIAKLRRLVNEG